MTPEEKRKILLDTLDKVTKIVKAYNKPYSDAMWCKFIEKMNNILGSIPDKELRTMVYKLMSDTTEFVNKHLNEEEKENDLWDQL